MVARWQWRQPGQDSSAVLVGGDEVDQLATDSGAVYVFSLSADNWQQQAFIKASNTGAGDGFGGRVALSANGNSLVVGAPYEQSLFAGQPEDNSAANAGAAYVYGRASGSWSFKAYLKALNAQSDGRFGSTVAIANNGATVAVGSAGEASIAIGVNGSQLDRSNAESGAAYVFNLEGDAWVQHSYIKASNGDIGDLFGSAIALNAAGSLLVVGAPGESSAAEGVSGTQSDNSATDAGAAYVFELNAGAWSQLKYVKASNAEAADGFGSYVSLDASGDVLAVGAPEERSSSTLFSDLQTSNALNAAGAVYLY